MKVIADQGNMGYLKIRAIEELSSNKGTYHQLIDSYESTIQMLTLAIIHANNEIAEGERSLD